METFFHKFERINLKINGVVDHAKLFFRQFHNDS